MKTSSAKNKGRRLQNWVKERLVDILRLDPEDINSRSMGSGGEDLIVGKQSREIFPLSVECKNSERVNVWAAYAQAFANAGGREPLVIIKRNNHKPLAVVDAEYFIGLFK